MQLNEGTRGLEDLNNTIGVIECDFYNTIGFIECDLDDTIGIIECHLHNTQYTKVYA